MILDTLANIPAAQIAAFMAGALVLNLVPGQDVMFATACGIRGGARAGMLAGVGVGLGALGHVLMATAGLGAVLAAHPELQRLIRFAGAGYLLWLAVASWRAPGGGGHQPAAPVPRRQGVDLIARGALNNLLNPKPVLFLLAFLPQFTNPAWGPLWQQVLGLGLMFVLSGTIVTMAYGGLAGLARQGLSRRMTVLNRIAALMFAGLALRLVAR